MKERRIASLDQRHARIDAEIADVSRRPSSDDLHIAQMKRERLSLKDQIVGIAR